MKLEFLLDKIPLKINKLNYLIIFKLLNNNEFIKKII